MVNQHSASAAEIVSGCLQDAGRAKVVGERSFGKGSVQNIIPLEGGTSFLKLTVESYFRPSGGNIHKFPDMSDEDEWGVSPSEGLAVELPPEEYARWELSRRRKDVTSRIARRIDGDENDEAEPPADRQLDKALEVLRSELGSEEEGDDAEPEGDPKDAEPEGEARETATPEPR
jgi:carboxyl-terminal processing protease